MIVEIREGKSRKTIPFEFREERLDGFLINLKKKKITIVVYGTSYITAYSIKLEDKLRRVLNKPNKV